MAIKPLSNGLVSGPVGRGDVRGVVVDLERRRHQLRAVDVLRLRGGQRRSHSHVVAAVGAVASPVSLRFGDGDARQSRGQFVPDPGWIPDAGKLSDLRDVRL